MFICRACARRATNSLLRQPPATNPRLAAPSRTFTTSTTSNSLREPPRRDERVQIEVAAVAERKGDKNRDKNPYASREDWVDKANTEKRTPEKLKRAVKKELQLTTDPFHIAENVHKKLKENDFEKALMLAREASKDKQVVVSWNHLIEHQFAHQKLGAAIKLYNEMKKRAQLPNAHTFTIIFKGCANSGHPKLAVGEALKIYNAMLSSSRLKPNTIHLNAVLDVCARAGDLESMFVALRSAGGLRAPDKMTYTIILNALRHQPSNLVNPNEDPKEQAKAVARSIETTIARAKLVWDEVITRWKKGEIIMDEELLCAMGRLLLLGGTKETDSVLRVLGEVLGITKLLDGQPGYVDPDATKTPTPPKQSDPDRDIEAGGLEHLSETGMPQKPDKADEYSSQKPPKPDPKQHQQQTPGQAPKSVARMAGNNTLSLLMRVLANDKRTKLAARYWDYMTQSYGIVPDRRNYRDYIDCLSTGAASGKAARVLLSLPDAVADANLYRRGLLMCHFDAFNDRAFENATMIYDAMAKKLKTPDVRCMRVYLNVAVSNYRRFGEVPANFRTQRVGDRAYGVQMFTALDRVFEPLRRATNDLSYSSVATSAKSPEDAWRLNYANREELIDVARTFLATSDKLLSRALIPKQHDNHKVAVIRRKVMHEFIQRWMAKNEQYRPRRDLSSGRGRRHRGDEDEGEASDKQSRVSM